MAMLVAAQARAEDDFNLRPLVAMRGVHVTVSVTNGFASLGITKEALRTLVELTLRRSGIRVLSEKEMYSTAGMPEARVSVSLLAASDGMVVYTTRLYICQNVIGSNGLQVVGAETWTDAGSIGIAHRLTLLSVIRSSVEEMAENLSNDYLKANQPKPVVEDEVTDEDLRRAEDATSTKRPAPKPKPIGREMKL
ncbi:hypothetical protein [Corallococcus caeni]